MGDALLRLKYLMQKQMKSVQSLRVFILIICLVNSSCASFAMGTARECKAPVIPIRPPNYTCISNEFGVGQCYNPVTEKNEPRSMKNFICRHPSDAQRDEEWVESVLEAIKQ